MSGHSHWRTIKRKKESADIKRGKIFSKITRALSVAARKGEDPETNPKLRLAIERAKALNMPKENIRRAIKRGTRELAEGELEEILFEAYGPGGVAIIVEGITDNKNRTLNEISQILKQCKGKLAKEGSVRWQFERRGVITLDLDAQSDAFKDKEALALKAIEAGAENIYWHNGLLDVYVKIEDLEGAKENLKREKIKIESASLDWVAKKMVKMEEKENQLVEKLFEALDENEAVQEIYSNLKL